MSNALSELLAAADYAAERHAGQRRKGAAGEPYINHLIEVAKLLADATDGEDRTLVIAGLLHDVVEDAGVTNAEVAGRFGRDVAGLVAEVTDDKSLPKAERKRLQVENAPRKSPRAKMLKLADKISNLRAITASPPTDWPEQRKIDYFTWAKQVADGCRGVNMRLEELFDETYHAGMEKLTDPAPGAR